MPETQNIDQNQWELVGAWPDIGINDSEIWQGETANREFHALFGMEKRHLNLFIAGWHQHLYRPVGLADKLNGHFDTLLADSMAAHILLVRLRGIRDLASEFTEQCRHGDIKELPPQELSKRYRHIRGLRQKLGAYNQFGILCAEILAGRVQALITARSPDATAHSLLLTTILADQPESSLEKERSALQEAAVCCLGHESVVQAKVSGKLEALRAAINLSCPAQIEKLTADHGWLPVFLRGAEWNRGHYATQLTQICQSQSVEQLQIAAAKAVEGRMSRTANAQAAINTLDLSPCETALIAITQAAIYAKNEAEYLQGYLSRMERPLARQIDAVLGIDEELRQSLRDAEISQLLEASNPAAVLASLAAALKQRESYYGYCSDGTRGCHELAVEDVAELLRKRMAPQETAATAATGALHGTCASVGEAMGKARLIRSAADFSRLADGEVLVAQMTTVDYVPLMRRAAAIITEYGGVTCHAAVIARELNVPCVVGVRRALAVIQDGQEVHVNASRGEVRLT
ncbi:PEP-utilizing enzyme [Prosthecobacter sp.]|uniref:PEP-utilizing enzyme n=1 Tax=Prosthecobacter sp. TaxID=1965333 RepID=UPI003783B98E